MVRKIVITAGILIAGVLVYAAFQPSTFLISRSVSINAAPEKIYPYMSDFHKGDLWTPYKKRDPSMKRTYSGAPSGKGAVYEFAGDKKKVGSGRLEIIEAVPPYKVVLTLDLFEPMKGRNIVEYTLEPKGGSTNVTWSMRGTNNYLSKLICTFISVDKMVGNDFEAGLTNLKALLEKS
jgi:uncharacterized protein YndB with AHSA1/START domain